MICSCCNKESEKHRVKLYSDDGKISFELGIQHDLCEECFAFCDVVGIKNSKEIEYKVGEMPERRKELFWEREGLVESDFIGYDEAFKILIEKGVTTQLSAERHQRAKVVKLYLEDKMIDKILVPDGVSVSGEKVQFNKKEFCDLVDFHNQFKWTKNKKHELTDEQLECLRTANHFKKTEDGLFFSYFKDTKRRPCIKCGEVKDDNQFPSFNHFMPWRCSGCAKKYTLKRYNENPEKSIAATKQWAKNNPDKVKAYKKTPKARMHKNIRSRLKDFMKKSDTSYDKSVGVNRKQLIEHIESQWSDGMNWDNYGSGENGDHVGAWHVDHRICLSKWDEVVVEGHPFFGLSPNFFLNLQPMWAKDNMKKSNKII